jgi:hypothetical protein
MLYVVSAILFFFEAVGVNVIPHPMVWGFFFMALGLAVGGPSWTFWKKA